MRLNDSIHPTDKGAYRCVYTALLASSSYLDQADEVVTNLSHSSDSGIIAGQTYCFAKGATELYRGNPDSAIVNLQSSRDVLASFTVEYLLGQAYIASGDYDKAIEGLNKLYTTYRLWGACYTAKYNTIPYYLGLAYEGAGSPQMAVSSYSELMDIWKNADVEPELVKDGRMRLAKLSGAP
jgi:tetratricopeptide (TPR) repeat protein